MILSNSLCKTFYLYGLDNSMENGGATMVLNRPRQSTTNMNRRPSIHSHQFDYQQG